MAEDSLLELAGVVPAAERPCPLADSDFQPKAGVLLDWVRAEGQGTELFGCHTGLLALV